MPGHPHPTVSIRLLMLAVAVVAVSIRWSAHWIDCKHQAAFHAALAEDRQVFSGMTEMAAWARNRQALKTRWHEEMRRRFERAAWLPWPFPPSEPPRPWTK